MSAFATPSPSKISRYSRYGSWQVLAEAVFTRGLVTDTAPVALPTGGIADVRDYLFDINGKIRKRGGSATSSSLPGMVGTVNVAYAPFTAGDKIIAVGAYIGGGYYALDATPATSVTIGALPYAVAQPPVFYDDRLFLLYGASVTLGSPAMITNSGGTCAIADLGVAPQSSVACTHAGYLVVANDLVNHRNRLWFSPIPDPTATWDTANAYIDTAGPITGLASVQGVLIVFHAGSSERVLGSIPPGTPGENMSLQPLSGQAGTIDPGSIRQVAGTIYFADNSGVWVTNGASVTSVTERADGTGVSSLWRSTISAPLAGGHQKAIRAGAFGNDYFLVAILDIPTGASTGFVTMLQLAYHVSTGSWTRLRIEPFSGYASSSAALETYAAASNAGRVVTLSDLFANAPALSADADGVAVAPTVTSRVMGQGPFEKAWGDGHLTYDMRTSSGATLALTYSRDIEQQTFQSSSTFAGVAAPTRQRFPISGDGYGYSWRIAQTGASSKTELYAVEVEHRNYEEQADF